MRQYELVHIIYASRLGTEALILTKIKKLKNKR